MKKPSSTILAAAVTGLLMGGATGCASTGNGMTASVPADIEKHICAGKNSCRNQGGCKSQGGCMAKNDCAGKGGCATVKRHSCAGKNECAGKGGCGSGDNGCAGKNSCKSKGGCHVPLKKH
jgi:hypothetical protein